MDISRLPNLLVVGVPKAGTGSLFAYLTQHPEICGADEKEVGYFNYYNPLRHAGEPPPLEMYRKHFAHCSSERYVMEATPTYSYGGQPVIEAIRAVLGAPKIIISLRDPVDRLWSAYTFQRTLGNITHLKSFSDYVSRCEQRMPDGSDLVPHDHLHGFYIGFYANHIAHWLDGFGDDLAVVFAEDLARDTASVMTGLFEWLEIDPAAAAALDLAPRNRTVHARSPKVAKLVFSLKRSIESMGLLPPKMRAPLRSAYERINAGTVPEGLNPQVRRRLDDIYRSSNIATAEALTAHGYRDLPAWLQVGSARGSTT